MPKISFIKEQLFPLNHITGVDDYGKIIDGMVENSDARRYLPNDANDANTYPNSIIFDLRGYYTLEKIRYRDETGVQTIRFFKCVNPANLSLSSFTQIGSDIVLSGFQNDTTTFSELIDTTPGVRYVMVQMVTSIGRYPSEIEIWGTLTQADWTEPTIPARPPVSFSNILGINAFHWDNYTHIGLFNSQRIFFDTSWVTTTEGLYRFSPGYSAVVDIKNQITLANSTNTSVVYCLQKSAVWMKNVDSTTHSDDYKPIPFNADPFIVSSYLRHSDVYKQFAIYLGDGTAGLSQSKIDPTNNVKEVNLNKDFYLEIDNEPDKYWKNTWGFFHPWAYMAYCKCVYDAVKSVSANIRVVCGGLSNKDPFYLKACWLWAKHNNNGVMPFDVINYHLYPADGTLQQNGTRGTSPEAYNLYTKITDLQYWRNKYCPTLEFWDTEFGYDTNISDKKAQYNGVGAPGDPILQGRWLLRCFFIFGKAKVEKAFIYWLADQNGYVSSGNDRFLMSGIVSSLATNEVPKASYQFISTLSSLIKGRNYVFSEDLTSGNLYCYRFYDNVTKKHLFVLWQGTENVSAVKTSTLSGSITLTTPLLAVSTNQGVFESGNVANVTAVLNGSNQIVSLTTATNESPNYFIVTEDLNDNIAPTAPILTSSAQNSTSATLNWSASTDNIEVINYNIYKNGVLLHTVAFNVYSYIATGLVTSTSYAFTVRAVDSSSNLSVPSNTINITPTPDSIAPSAPVLSYTTLTNVGVVLNWTASTDNEGVTGYDVYKNGIFLINVNSLTYSVTSLASSTNFTFSIKAKDAVGNASVFSNTVSVTTFATVSQVLLTTSPIPTIESYFVTGAVPTESQFKVMMNTLRCEHTRTISGSGQITLSFDQDFKGYALQTGNIIFDVSASANNYEGIHGVITIDANPSYTITIPITWINENPAILYDNTKRNRFFFRIDTSEIIYRIVKSNIPS